MSAAERNAKGKRVPAISAICPVNAKIPAPIITPVPRATAPISVRLFSWYLVVLSAECFIKKLQYHSLTLSLTSVKTIYFLFFLFKVFFGLFAYIYFLFVCQII
jgi:hypothetical protein